MANILIIDDQAWVKDLCRESLAGERFTVSTTDDIESVMKNILSFNPHIVLLNQYLKHGFLVWDVLQGIKMRHPNLPVLIVTAHDKHLFDPHLSQADGYLVKSHTAAHELREKISNLLNQLPVV
jgi:DNA-binding NtrC family response regulator